MARPLRLEFPGALYHLTARGNARQAIFLDDEDRRAFLGLLGREVEQQRWRCHAYCLMDNHYHLLVETPEGRLVGGMRRLNGVYTQGFNRRHQRVGHVFQGRYKSIVVDKDSYLLELSRYVVLNPVRAGMVRRVEEWAWSSYRATAGLRKGPGWLDTSWLLGQFGEEPQRARLAYRRFVREGVGGQSPWPSLRGQIWLGGEAFLARMQRLVPGQSAQAVPREQTQPARPDAKRVLAAVAKAYGLAGREAVLERASEPAFRAAVYLLRRAANLSLKEVAALVGLSLGRISQLQRAVEESSPDVVLARLLRDFKLKH